MVDTLETLLDKYYNIYSEVMGLEPDELNHLFGEAIAMAKVYGERAPVDDDCQINIRVEFNDDGEIVSTSEPWRVNTSANARMKGLGGTHSGMQDSCPDGVWDGTYDETLDIEADPGIDSYEAGRALLIEGHKRVLEREGRIDPDTSSDLSHSDVLHY